MSNKAQRLTFPSNYFIMSLYYRSRFMPSMNISLTNELMELVHQKVQSGLYNNASEVIREAIRNLDQNEQLLYEFKLNKLKQTLKPSIDQVEQGQYSDYSYDELINDIDTQ